jgi:hypothetical protein
VTSGNALKMSEADFQGRVIDTAQRLGWRVVHHRHARHADGSWRTPMTGDKGFPDLVLSRDGVVILAELKSDTGKLGPGQQEWLDALGPHGRLWRPRDWPEVHAELSRREAA